MRLTSELRSPLTPALALVGAALFFAQEPGDTSLPWLGVAALLLAGALFATQSPPAGMVVLLPLAGLAAWCALSVAWSVEPDRSWTYSNRTFVYVAFAVIGALLGADPPRLLFGLAGLLGAVCVWSLAGKVLPWLYEDYGRISRLRGPVGYWNTLALLGDIALPIGLCLATRRRTFGTLLVYGWLVVLGMTYSRGGVLVALVVIALWMVLSKAWMEATSTLLAAGLPAAGSLAVAFALSGLTSDGQSHPTRVRDGLVFGAVLVINGAIAGALANYPLPAVPAARRAALVLLAVALAAATAVSAVHAQSWWHSFTSPTGAELSNSPSRLADTGSNFRWGWWAQAWDGFKTDPLKGTGAGSFSVTNQRYRDSSLDQTTEPHNLAVQFLSETGVIGLLLFLGSIVWLVVAGRRRPGPQLALALALPAYFLHGLVDVDWDFISVSALVFLIAGALAVRRSDRPRPRAFTVLTASGVLLAVGFSLFAVWLGNRWEGQAEAALGSDDNRAISLAHQVRTINPLTVDPLNTAAIAEIDIAEKIKKAHAKGWLRRYRETNALALGFLTKATEIQPDNADAWFQLAYYELKVQKCPRAALPDFSRFTVLNGQDPRNVYYAQALKLVNSGKPKC